MEIHAILQNTFDALNQRVIIPAPSKTFMKSSTIIHPALRPSSHSGADQALEGACVMGTMWPTGVSYRPGFNVQNLKPQPERTGFQCLH